MRAEAESGTVVVRVRGRVSAADHVYAHDRVAQLRHLAGQAQFRGVVTIVAEDPRRRGVSASAEVHLDGRTAHARTEAENVATAIDLLHDEIRERLRVLGVGDEGGNDASSRR